MSKSGLSPYQLEIGRKGSQVRLRYGDAIIGRHPKECQIILNQSSISRTHCLLRVTREDVILKDLGSTNGTYLNGRRIEEEVIVDGDCFRVGRAIFRLAYLGQAEAQAGIPVCPVSSSAEIKASETQEFSTQIPSRMESESPLPNPPEETFGETFDLGEIPDGEPDDADDVIHDRLLDMLFEDDD